MTPVSSIRNLGPATEAAFARAGIRSAEALREIGPDAAYGRLLAAGEKTHFIAWYALVMGLQGRPWNDCRGAEKAALRVRFDAIVTGQMAHGHPELDRLMNEIGLLPAPRDTRTQVDGDSTRA